MHLARQSSALKVERLANRRTTKRKTARLTKSITALNRSAKSSSSPLNESAMNVLLEYDDEDDEEEKDEEEMKQLENQGDHLLVKIMASHAQLISKKWIALSICVQILILGLAFATFYQSTLYAFTDGSGDLTPLFFWPNPNRAHSVEKYWWFYFSDTDRCASANVTGDTCKTLKLIRYSNSFLVAGLAIAFVFTLISMVMLILMFFKKYYRFTNCVLFVPGFSFLVVPIVWYLISDSISETTEVRWITLGIIEVFGLLEMICYCGGRYYTG